MCGEKMTEVKYEHPLDYYTVDNFINGSRKMIGKPVQGIATPPKNNEADYHSISGYARSLGDDNPLFNDVLYAVTKAKYSTVIAPPTFLTILRYPIYEGALFDGPYPLVGIEAAFDWVWNDVVKMNDRFTTEMILKDVYEKTGDKGRTVYLVSECKYRNALSNKLVATCNGTYAAIARAESITEIPEAAKEGFAKQPISDRKVHYYSDEEIERLIKDIGGMAMRGYYPLYWDDVNIGDELAPVVKGPLTTGALMSYHGTVFNIDAFPTFENSFHKWLKKPGFLRTNPLTGWPYDLQMAEHNDPNMSAARGMPYMFGLGSLKAGLCTHLLSNWMGDDGYIRRLKVDVLEPYLYGDALWIKGKVVEKYKEKIGGVLYLAVDIKIESINQEGQNVAPGTATLYLPSITQPVELPILQ